MPIMEVEQRSSEWLIARTGCCTGSRVKDVVAKLKNGKHSTSRENYMMEVVCERLTGLHIDHYVTPDMQYGIDNEDAARDAYETATREFADQVGLAFHPEMEYYCASPDRFVGPDGILEIKCPKPTTHLEWIQAGDVPAEHIPQMKAVMSCSERKWCDFVSYCPKMPKNIRLFIKRLEWDREMIEKQDEEVRLFLKEAAALEKVLKGMTL